MFPGSSDLRYTFWNYLKLEVTCLREYAGHRLLPLERLDLTVQTHFHAIFAAVLRALVAQLDRAPDYGSGGLGFDSLRVHT